MARINPQTGQLEDDNGNPIVAGMPSPGGNVAMLDISRPPDMFAASQGGPPPPLSTPGLPAAPLPAPPAPADAPLPGAAPIPIGGMTRATSSTTRSHEIAAPGEEAAMKKVQGDFTKEATLARREGDVLGKKADAEKEGASALSTGASDTEAKLAKTMGEQGQAVAAAQQQVESDRKKYDDERAKLAGMKVEDYYTGRTGLLIGNAIAVGLGQIGAALAHSGHNTALEIVQSGEHDYYARERLKIENQKDVVGNAKDAVGLSQQGISNARLSKADALSDLNLTSAARADAIAAQTRAKAAEIGTEHAKIEGEKIANAMEQKRDQYLLNYKQSLRAKVSSETQSVAGTGQGAAGAGRAAGQQMQQATMATQMQEDMHTILHGPEITQADWAKYQDNLTRMQGLEQAHGFGEKALAVGLRSAGITPRSAMQGIPAEKQKVMSSWDLGATKAATVLSASGARESIQELKAQFMPSPNDSPVAVAQKFAYMRSMAAVAMQNSGQYGVNAAAAAQRAGSGPTPGGNEDQEAINWAQSNRGDPRAKRILQLHGM